MFFFSEAHCPWWWNYTKTLEQVSLQRWNPNLWHFEQNFYFSCQNVGFIEDQPFKQLKFFKIWNKPCSNRKWSGGNCGGNQGMSFNVSARSESCLKFSFSVWPMICIFFSPMSSTLTSLVMMSQFFSVLNQPDVVQTFCYQFKVWLLGRDFPLDSWALWLLSYLFRGKKKEKKRLLRIFFQLL